MRTWCATPHNLRLCFGVGVGLIVIVIIHLIILVVGPLRVHVPSHHTSSHHSCPSHRSSSSGHSIPPVSPGATTVKSCCCCLNSLFPLFFPSGRATTGAITLPFASSSSFSLSSSHSVLRLLGKVIFGEEKEP